MTSINPWVMALLIFVSLWHVVDIIRSPRYRNRRAVTEAIGLVALCVAYGTGSTTWLYWSYGVITGGALAGRPGDSA